MSGKIDYQAHQQQFWEQLEKQPTLTLAEYCEANGLKYGTAKRYIKRPAKTGGKFQPSVMPKIKAKKTSQGNDWHSLLKEFLVRGAQNPTLTMAAFAKDKGVNGATLRRQFNSMRSLPEFDRLFDLYDEQLAKFQEAKNDKKKKRADKSKSKEAGATAQAQSAQGDRAKTGGIGSLRKPRSVEGLSQYSSAQVGRPVVHGGYARSAGITGEIMDILMDTDPLSVCNELIIARSQYYRMNETLAKRLKEIDEMEESGDIPLDDENQPVDINAMRDRLIFGYGTRLRELELSISTMAKQEAKRYIDLRKQEYAELMMPHLLPAEESSLVIEMLSLRTKNNWTALETCQQIEKLGARPPATLLHEAKVELANLEPEVDDTGISEQELDELFDDYTLEQIEQQDNWLPARKEEVNRRIKEAEDLENGVEPTLSPSQIQNEAAKEQAYDDLDNEGVSGFDDVDSFEVLGG